MKTVIMVENVLAMSRQEIVSVGLDTMETPAMREKSLKVKLKAVIYVKTMADHRQIVKI